MKLSTDYLDADVAYLLGCMVARGELISEKGIHTAIIHFPKGSFIAEGENLRFDTEKEIRLGIEKIRDRFLDLFSADIKTHDTGESISLVITSTRNTIAWRDLNMLLEGKTSYSFFSVPPILFDPDVPFEVKSEFIRGFADVGGNVRIANRDQIGRHRVRLDVLNSPANWDLPVQVCTLLQEHLQVPVPVITYGHPNLGREWREHQINIYCDDFTKVGFHFDFKQAALENLSEANYAHFPNHVTKFCPGRRRRIKAHKPPHALENCVERLDPRLSGKHFDWYWQICKALGCQRKPSPGDQLEFPFEE